MELLNALIFFYLADKETGKLKLLPQTIEDNRLKKIENAVAKLSKGVPIQYITKCVKFYNRVFYIERGVFIPRLDTEYLIDLALERIKGINNSIECLDICTGAGVIPITLILENPSIRATCLDISKKALKLAFLNAYRFGVLDKLEIVHSDLFDNLGELYYNRLDFITANPPYVPSSRYRKLHCSIFYEPRRAIVAKDGGMHVIKRMIHSYRKFLKKGGFFIFEFPIYNKEMVRKVLIESRTGNFKFFYENNTGFVCIENDG